MKKIKTTFNLLIFSFLIFITPLQVFAINIYTENFTGENGKGAQGATIDTTGVNWSIDISNAVLSSNSDWFRVVSQRFEARDLDGDAIWESALINISAYQNVNFQLDASESGSHENADHLNVYYKVNGGSYTLIPNWGGNGNASNTLRNDFPDTTITQSIGIATSLKIRVIMKNNSGSEYLRFDNVLVTGDIFNAIPTANAGVNKSITLGNSVNIVGSGSDTDGTITGYVWKEGATTLSTNASFTYTPVTGGTHTLTLTVKDNNGATASDSMTVTVQAPPSANAGPNQTLTAGTITFDGSGSSDSDGTISSYVWSYNATNIATGVNGTFGASAFAPGNYLVTLTVTDNDGFTDTDTVTIEIIPSNTPNISIDPTTTSIVSGTASVALDVNLNIAGNAGAVTINYGGTCGATGTVNIAQGSTSGSITVNTSVFPVGSCTVVLSSATGSNGQLAGTISPSTSTITVTAAPISVDISVSTGSDDAEQQEDNSMYTDSSDLEMVDDGNEQIIGIRFLVNLPVGTTITNAYIKFHADGSSSTNTSLNIYAQNSGSTNTFNSTNNNITDRPKTSAIAWNNILSWSGGTHYDTPNLTTIIQTVIDRGDWANSSLAFIIDGSGKRRAESSEGGGDAPVLHLEYTSNPPPLANAGPNQYLAIGDNIIFNGSASTDDTSIVDYTWRIGTTTIATGVNPTLIGGLPLGIHTVTLTVTDDAGGTGEDTVIIAVSSAGNDAPVIISNGGGATANITIGPSETSITTVDAVDPDGDTPIIYSITGGTDSALFTIGTTTGLLNLNTVGTPGNDYIVVVTVRDPSGATDTQTITVTVDDPLVFFEGDRPFTIRNPPATRNIRGNYAIIGNSNLCALDTSSTSSLSGSCYDSGSNSRPSRYIDIDSDNSTKNSTSSTLALPANSTVIWAGLYWQGVVHNATNNNNDFMGDEGVYNGTKITGEPEISNTQINFTTSSSTFGAEEVKLKLPGNSNYIDIVASQLDYSGLGYAGFKDITYLIDSVNFDGRYTVADIKSHQGVENDHGNYAAWGIVVIYINSGETSKNITLFDGYATVDSSFSQELVMDGFLTPQLPPIESKLALFALDGDNGSNKLEIISENGVTTEITNQDNTNNSLFDATISSSIIRDTSNTSLRTDLKVLDLLNVLGPNETEATIRPTTNGDRYTPSFFIMSADLRVPKLCYDYSVTTADDTKFTDNPKANPLNAAQYGHEVTSANFSGEEHITKIFIRSEEGDLALENVSVGVTDFNTTRISFNRGEISHNGNFAYIPVSPIVTNPDPFLPFGNDDGNFNDGGTISPNQSFYGKFYFTSTGNGGDLDEFINITVVTHLNFGSGLAQFTSSTKDTTDPLERCARNPVYDPSLGNFSIERSGATHNGTTETERYPLYTQIVGHPFKVSVVAQDVSVSGNTLPPLLAVSNIGIELELIEAGSFDNNASTGFDILCEDYSREDILENKFVQFEDNILREHVDVPAFIPTKALRNAAFRVWYVTDNNGSMVFDNECYAPNHTNRDGCFSGKYNTGVRAQLDPTNIFCEAQCVTGTTGCYECIKTNFAHPVCSRDNFSIRPAAIHVKLDDGDNTNLPIVTVIENNISYATPPKLAAGYPYPGTFKAVDYSGINIALSYYSNFATIAIPENDINEAKFSFVDDANTFCADITDLPIASGTLHIRNGVLSEDINVTGQNAGEYTLSLRDNTWTKVDQSTYTYMTLFDGASHTDCSLNDSTTDNAMFGCDVSSDVVGYGGRDDFTDVTIDFRPYKFDVSTLLFNTVPNKQVAGRNLLFMTNFTDAYYSTLQNDVMAVKIEGNITAQGKDGVTLTNYTNGCSANDTTISLDVNLTGVNHSLVYDILDPIQNGNLAANDINMTLIKAGFKDNQAGIANIILYSTFTKILDTPTNPINLAYEKLSIRGTNDISYAEKVANHTADGNITYDENLTFYYGKISAKEKRYDNVITSSKQTPISIDIYCDGVSVSCGDYHLNTESIGEVSDVGWWYVASMFDNNMLGTTDLTVSTISTLSANPAASPNISVDFDDNNASQVNLEISVSGDNRPTVIQIQYNAQPWLIDNTLTDNYQVEFIENGTWAGVGNTGNVVETKSNASPQNRMNW